MSNPERKRRICGKGIVLDFVSCNTVSETGLEAAGRDGIGAETDTVPRLVSRYSLLCPSSIVRMPSEETTIFPGYGPTSVSNENSVSAHCSPKSMMSCPGKASKAGSGSALTVIMNPTAMEQANNKLNIHRFIALTSYSFCGNEEEGQGPTSSKSRPR